MSDHHSAFPSALAAAHDHALAYLEALDRAPVAGRTGLATLRQRLGKPLTDEPLPPEQVVRELVRDVEGGLVGTAGGRFFGWVIGGSLPAALAADWLTSAWDQNACLYAASPAAAVVEEVAGAWLKDLLRLPASSSFALVTGTQMADVVCLAAARHALLTRQGWDLEQRGLYGAPPIRLLASDQRHGTADRAIRLLGFGRAQLELVPTDHLGRVRPEELERAFQSDPAAPAIVLLQAGDINTGAYDDFATLIPIARRYAAWIHIDGAFGLWAAASPRYAHLMNGAEAADSWVTDGHKWLNVPYDSGFAFVADPESHRASMSHRASYLTHAADARDQMDWNPEWSRRARGFATYAALRQLGRKGVTHLVDRACRHTREIVAGIGALPGAEVLSEPIINQGLVRFLHPIAGVPESDHDQHTERVIAAVLESGEAFFTPTTWHGKRAMRVSVSNWRTNEADVARVMRAFAHALDTINAEIIPQG
jgi:glutamate/tyrosine decarboxylase-like PLP-dependent enzyme